MSIAGIPELRNESPLPFGALLLTCTDADHDALRIEAADHIADRRPFGSLTSARCASWLERRRAWPEAGVAIGECVCGSTIAVEAP